MRIEGGAGNGDAPEARFELRGADEHPDSISRLRGFQGNFGVFVRSYAYILSLGGDGLAEASETAVLNANYLLARMREGRAGKYLPVAFDRPPMHEFVLSGSGAKRELGVKTSVSQGLNGLFAPKGLPPDVKAALERACAAAVRTDGVARAMQNTGVTVDYLSAGEFRDRSVADYKFKGELIRRLGLESQ